MSQKFIFYILLASYLLNLGTFLVTLKREDYKKWTTYVLIFMCPLIFFFAAVAVKIEDNKNKPSKL